MLPERQELASKQQLSNTQAALEVVVSASALSQSPCLYISPSAFFDLPLLTCLLRWAFFSGWGLTLVSWVGHSSCSVLVFSNISVKAPPSEKQQLVTRRESQLSIHSCHM